MLYTTADLLTAIKSKAAMPDSQTVFTDPRLLQLADEKIRSLIVPAVLATREDYYLTYIDYASPANVYAIPRNAIGMKVSRVCFVDSDGSEWPCVRVANVVESYEDSSKFYIMKNTIYFDSTPTKTVRIYYHVRPLVLARTTDSMQIVSITGSDIEVASVPTTIVSTKYLNGIDAYPGYETLMPSNMVASVLTTTLTMTDAPPSTLKVGDWMSLEGYTAVPQIPYEMQPVLEWAVAVPVLKSQGDNEAAGAAEAEQQKALQNAMVILQPRVDGASKKIVNRESLLRQSSDYYNFGVWVR